MFCFLSCLSQFEFLSLSFSLPHKNLCFTFCFQGFHFDLVSLIHKYGILTHGSVLNLQEEKRKIWSLLLESWLLCGNLYSSFLISLGYCFWVSLKVTNFILTYFNQSFRLEFDVGIPYSIDEIGCLICCVGLIRICFIYSSSASFYS